MNPMEQLPANDARHALAEAWRIVRARRWWLMLTFLAATTIACAASHWLPRRYAGRTLFERRNDVVLQSLIGSAWNQMFDGQRKSLTFDLAGPAALSEAMQQLDEAASWPRDPQGGLTGEGQRQSAGLAARVADRVEVKVLESTPQRDVIEVSMVDSDPSLASRVVVALRDSYVQRSKAKMLALLEESLEYFSREAGRSQALVRATESKLSELERECPGVLPEYAASISGEVNGLTFERAELRRRILELKSAEQTLQHQLAGKPAPADGASAPPAAPPETPQRMALAAEMQRVESQINDERVLRGKTELHPTIAALRDKLAKLRDEYRAAAPATAAQQQLVAAAARVDETRKAQLEQQLQSTREQVAMTQERAAAIQSRLDQIESRKVAGAARRQDHLGLTEELSANRAELAAWQKQIDPIQRILDAQKRDRGVRFISVQEPGTVARPRSPDARVVLLGCLVIGLVAAALAVLAVELVDRSFRSAVQVAGSLGIPVLETIHEIITAREQRRRVVMHLVVLPTGAVAGLLLAVSTAAGAYLSLEAPWLYEPLRLDPVKTIQAIWRDPTQLRELTGLSPQQAIPLEAAAAALATAEQQEQDVTDHGAMKHKGLSWDE